MACLRQQIDTLINLSPHVASVGAVAALGIYYAPKVDITTVSLPSRAVTAGSMRGYGTLQAMTALEVLVDEMCTALPLDPIEFRRRNALKPGERTLTGNTYDDSIRTPAILDKLEQHAIWRERAAEKARGKEAGILVGTGVACAHKNYGTGADCSLGAVEIDPQGRIAIRIDDTEIGNGLGTAVANRVAAHLGGVADEVALAQIDAFGPLALVKSGDPYTIDQKTQDAAARNPRWVPEISSATAASTGAHVGTHAAAEAARVIFRFGLWPAALDLWRIGPKDSRAAQWQTVRWKDGQLAAPGLSPLALRMQGTASPVQWPMVLIAGPGRRPTSRSTDKTGPPISTRWRCAAAAASSSASIHQRQVSANRLHPDRHHLHDEVRHAGPRRDQSLNWSAAHRQGL
jgi:CO/xanthine dehydrogenase Mo-binding subunit